ncbi:antibiotic biosynthesis monooxygenase [Streptomyces sp. NBC_00878]|uniref:antibiotic biosynthesis monooxygenase n=1 Tax=Streptomyces sp. NBC_00878 TaxID=2975854 RepID=UPI0022534615|nr:antibiotic biosynthesis monooxygenase [Streptomyces sp. NBC_00878]MCX4905893.1 antibiotic biosynthesis monooxygenase [Streptomyces sp. NBC_00878]
MPIETGQSVEAVQSDPASVMITRTVHPGREDDYKHWLVRLINAAEKFPNNLGTAVLAPTPGKSNVFRLVHRFTDQESLRAWEDSDIRHALSAEADAFSTSQRQAATGMETWFSISEAPALPPPKKWKMALVTIGAVYGLTAVIIPLEMAWVPRSWSFYLTNVITNVLIGGLMTYLVMPTVTRVLRRWLY